MIGAILKATNISFQTGMTYCRSISVKKAMKLLAFIFEQPSYKHRTPTNNGKYIKQRSTTTKPAPKNGQQPKPGGGGGGGGLNAIY